jgi:hypothetical protein
MASKATGDAAHSQENKAFPHAPAEGRAEGRTGDPDFGSESGSKAPPDPPASERLLTLISSLTPEERAALAALLTGGADTTRPRSE